MESEEMSSHETKRILDKSCMEVLKLTEDYINKKLQIEKTMDAGEYQLIKTRHNLNSSRDLSIRIPNENIELKANLKVNIEEDSSVIGGQVIQFEKSMTNSNEICKKMFGIFVPETIRLAQEKFSLSLRLIEECVNIQIQISELLKQFFSLELNFNSNLLDFK